MRWFSIFHKWLKRGVWVLLLKSLSLLILRTWLYVLCPVFALTSGTLHHTGHLPNGTYSYRLGNLSKVWHQLRLVVGFLQVFPLRESTPQFSNPILYIRGASTSKAHSQGLSLKQILSAAHWSDKSDTFYRFYLRQSEIPANYTQAILSN